MPAASMLIGDLNAGGRRTDHEYAPVGYGARRTISTGMQVCHKRIDGTGDVRKIGQIALTGCHDNDLRAKCLDRLLSGIRLLHALAK